MTTPCIYTYVYMPICLCVRLNILYVYCNLHCILYIHSAMIGPSSFIYKNIMFSNHEAIDTDPETMLSIYLCHIIIVTPLETSMHIYIADVQHIVPSCLIILCMCASDIARVLIFSTYVVIHNNGHCNVHGLILERYI